MPPKINMEEQKRIQKRARNTADKLISRLDEASKKETVSKVEVTVLLKSLEKEQQTILEVDQKILALMPANSTTEEDEEKEYSEQLDFNMKIMTAQLEYEKLLFEPMETPVAPSEAAKTVQSGADLMSRGYLLPKIVPMKFSGELKDWIGFWSSFQKIHEDTGLPGSHKFHYLLQSLTPGTDAYEIASSYPQSDENYEKVVQSIRKRYGNEDLLLQVYVRELLKLVISNVNSNNKIPFHTLHLKLDSYLRALKTLNLEKADPATWLFPLVESSLPMEILLQWQRSRKAVETAQDGSQVGGMSRLDHLMDFLGKEVEINQRINLAQDGFDLDKKSLRDKGQIRIKPHSQVPTLNSCLAADYKCIFCDGSHAPQECRNVRGWTLEEKRDHLRKYRLCFKCLKDGHSSSNCYTKPRCKNCRGAHIAVMCNRLSKGDIRKQSVVDTGKNEQSKPERKRPEQDRDQDKGNDKNVAACSNVDYLANFNNQTCSRRIALQTCKVLARNGTKQKEVRVFLDTGSQGSYILKSTAEELDLDIVEEVSHPHSLFGGQQTKVIRHRKYELTLINPETGYACQVAVKDVDVICAQIPAVLPTVWKEAKQQSIILSDIDDGSNKTIEILIGANLYGMLVTGGLVKLPCGAVAVETKLGWTVIGTIQAMEDDFKTMSALSMGNLDGSIANLWKLDLLGIREETDVKTAKDFEQELKDKFISGLGRNEDGRYIVSLPWKEGHPPLPVNREIAMRRLAGTTRKLELTGMFNAYSKLFEDWAKEGIIEEVAAAEQCPGSIVHYVSHRAVVKLSSATTPVRPVFDASCKVGKHPSLNDCQEKGLNYIEKIPDILLRFREKAVGMIADIRKAFQMIAVKPSDRDCMRFIWWKGSDKKEIVEYRHARVMFGSTSSPFILGCVLDHHLSSIADGKLVPIVQRNNPKDWSGYEAVAAKLLNTLYVDNVTNSEDTMDEYLDFRRKSIKLLADAQMDLRLWMSNVDEFQDPANDVVSVLGAKWDRKEDVIFVDVEGFKAPDVVTKRTLLSAAQKIFDPIGIVCPAVVPVKLILQRAWINQLKWDERLPESEQLEFQKWAAEVQELSQVRVPRNYSGGESDRSNWSVHVFTDASELAYGAAIFLRVQHIDRVTVQLLQAKARVCPVKGLTIPRAELLGCLIGSRLAESVKTTLKLDNVPFYYWSDSTTALAWIRRSENWGTYVGNRVDEIRKLSGKNNWYHVPGKMNPADLPSRGCSPRHLVDKNWCFGPDWLRLPKETWPRHEEPTEETLVLAEKKKLSEPVMSAFAMDRVRKQFTFLQAVRVYGWCIRFLYNAQLGKKPGPRFSEISLSSFEKKAGENMLIREIQQFLDVDKHNLRRLRSYRDQEGILRVKTKIVLRDDLESFRCPAILPGLDPIVRQLVKDIHEKNCHAGVGTVMTILREKYWVLKARKTVNSVILKCIKCRRFSTKPAVTEPPPLPIERVQDCRIFEAVGVDAAGPFYLKGATKAYIIIFTCAVYRAVRFEVVRKLDTKSFLEALSTFIRMNGRPKMLLSDNGTNFRGANNFFQTLDWEEIEKTEGIQRIRWKFSLPGNPTWGAFWERLIRVLKDLLKRTLGKSIVNGREFKKVLLSVEETINNRPLTYVSENADDLEPLTPAMFMWNPLVCRFPEEEKINDNLRTRWRYVEQLKREIVQRFRKEYLSTLVCRAKVKPTKPLKVGEIVLIGTDNVKRINWPLGKILEFHEGRDGISRVAVLKTANGIVVKTVQHLYRLEVSCDEGKDLGKSRPGVADKEKSSPQSNGEEGHQGPFQHF